MKVWKVGETATSIIIGWEPVASADGYRFYSSGVLRSRRMNNRPPYTVKFSKGQEPYEVEAVRLQALDRGAYPAGTPKPPDPPPATKRYAPRTHNIGSHNQDPRFCMRPEYGSVQLPDGTYVDQMGVRYDNEGLNLDGLRDRNRVVPELRGADDMNGLEPCDQYVGPTGVTVGGSAGYPAGSYER